MFGLKNLFKAKAQVLPFTKTQKELLELLLTNKAEFDLWSKGKSGDKIRFQFYYPTAIDFYYDDFKLFTAYFKKGVHDDLSLQELKMSEVNYETIRCTSWAPFEEVIIDFLTSLDENKKLALFEQRKVLFEYQSLCIKKNEASGTEQAYAKTAGTPLSFLRPTQ